MLKSFEFGNPRAQHVLIQLVDDHDLAGMEKEITAIRAATDVDFRLLALQVADWNRDLSPWPAPPVFGKAPFGNGAKETLQEVLTFTADPAKKYYLGGYSLAGLFALWAACESAVFRGIAAASPSVRGGLAVGLVPGLLRLSERKNFPEPVRLPEPRRQGKEDAQSRHGQRRRPHPRRL
ncbi:MAG: hypothetical protein MR586_06500 [Megasphaera elsdenii]|nr:hypothetical protein [Megasphaera elsdenii]